MTNAIKLGASLITALSLAACSSGEPETPEKKGFRRDYPTTISADRAVPGNLRQDYDALLACRGDLAARSGQKVPELDNNRIADIMDELERNPNAASECLEELYEA